MQKNRTWVILTAVATGLVCAEFLAAQSSPKPFEVGQRWRYRHEGPRPGNVDPNVIDGERILWVLSATEGPQGTQFVVEERFTNDEKVIGRLCVGGDGLLEAIEIETDKGETARLRYDPPVPYEPQGIAVGDTRTILTTLRMDSAGFALPCKTTIERLADETITAPAGDFAGCLHYRSVTASTFNVKIAKIPMTEERERWYHPAVQGMVKEVYRRGPVKFLGWSRPGYTATSVLIAYDRQEPEQVMGHAGSEGTITPAARELLASKPVTPAGRPIGWILPVLMLLAAGGLLLARRARNR